jgi:DNA-binding transcriptional ArsR family regulator
LLGELFTNADREYSVGELAGLVGASEPTVSREVKRLVEAGLLAAREDGRKRLVSAREDTPVFTPLRDLLSKVYGVTAVVAEELGHLDAQVLIFGSYAARWVGEPGPTPRDVDVLVLGDVEPLDAWDAAARASSRLGLEVNVVVRDTDSWEQDGSGLAKRVKLRPMIDLGALGAPSGGSPSGGALMAGPSYHVEGLPTAVVEFLERTNGSRGVRRTSATRPRCSSACSLRKQRMRSTQPPRIGG